MSTWNLDFFSTFLESGRGVSYEPTARSVRRTILEALAATKRLRYKQLWKAVYAFGVTGVQFTEGMRQLLAAGLISLSRDDTSAVDPDIVLTPAGDMAAETLAEVG